MHALKRLAKLKRLIDWRANLGVDPFKNHFHYSRWFGITMMLEMFFHGR